jgi:small subunit ribosomal protein S9
MPARRIRTVPSSLNHSPSSTHARAAETGATATMAKPLIQSTGRRKRAVARVRVRPGSGQIVINRRQVEDYFPSETHRMILTEPLRITNTAEVYDVDASIDGGGVSGQAGALRHGIARALAGLDPDLRAELKRAGFLTRDAREKESKKYGLKKARKAPQYSKR